MLIENPVVVYEDQKISEVLDNTMAQYNHVPVVNREGLYLGIVSKLHIYPHLLSGEVNKLVSDVVVPFSPISLTDWNVSLIEDLLEVLKGSKFLFIPIIGEDGKLAGIIPNKVVLELFGKSIGLDEEGEVLEVTSSDLAGSLNRMLEVFKNADVNIISINVLSLDVFNLRKVYIKFKGDKEIKEKMLGMLEDLGFKSF